MCVKCCCEDVVVVLRSKFYLIRVFNQKVGRHFTFTETKILVSPLPDTSDNTSMMFVPLVTFTSIMPLSAIIYLFKQMLCELLITISGHLTCHSLIPMKLTSEVPLCTV